MKKTSRYYNLKWVVECKWPNKPFYETIAAFNSLPVAREYMRECASGNKWFKYRVMERNGKKWDEPSANS